MTERLSRLNGIGPVITVTLAGEVHWRDFVNRRQVGSYVGLTGRRVPAAAIKGAA
ncbi:transposase [Vineibacter terrae]|uniref:Transposase n=1 Tax=Vineibacter terrae TaxID=2586908 RepID=A0A5C8PKS0_9HYPH|nr:transposase [Vineibacter terrae]TXL74503.1 transposase [Vineibacter terrae]HEX2888073.1 transposase [Vineibacter terrae]